MSWDMARLRAESYRSHKLHGPVGPAAIADGRNDCSCSECVAFSEVSCRRCGYHVCTTECAAGRLQRYEAIIGKEHLFLIATPSAAQLEGLRQWAELSWGDKP